MNKENKIASFALCFLGLVTVLFFVDGIRYGIKWELGYGILFLFIFCGVVFLIIKKVRERDLTNRFCEALCFERDIERALEIYKKLTFDSREDFASCLEGMGVDASSIEKGL
jgi:hypothetical protein